MGIKMNSVNIFDPAHADNCKIIESLCYEYILRIDIE